MGAGIGAIFGLAGGVLQGIGASRANAAQAAQMYAQAGQVIGQGVVTARDEVNQASIDGRQAKLLEQQGSYDAARATEKGRALIGAQVAGYAANGVSLSGSVADVIKSTGTAAGRDVAAMRYGVTANVKAERALVDVYQTRAMDTLHLAGAEALDLVQGAKNVASSSVLSFIAPIINAGGTALKSSFA